MVASDLLFWVAPLDRWVDQQAGVMCRRHADSIVVPVGWTLDDRREVAPRLFRPAPPPEPVHPAPRRRRPARTASASVPEPAALPLGDPEPAPARPPEPVWRPEFDDDALPEVRSPLLARAFRGVDRPKP
jgi:hypothetical protein